MTSPNNTAMSSGPRSVARKEAEEYAWNQIAALDPSMPLPAGSVAMMIADAYEKGRTAPTRGRLLERVAREHYDTYITVDVPDILKFDEIGPRDRQDVLASVRALLDRNVTEAGRPID